MMTSIEQVWEQLKGIAREYAERGSTPSLREAESVVGRLVRDLRVSPYPPPDVMEMYAHELIAMVDAARLESK